MEFPSGEILEVTRQPQSVPERLRLEVGQALRYTDLVEEVADELGNAVSRPPGDPIPPRAPGPDPPLVKMIRDDGLGEVGLRAQLAEHLYHRAFDGMPPDRFPAREITLDSGQVVRERARSLVPRPPFRAALIAEIFRAWQEHRHEKLYPRSEGGRWVFHSLVDLLGETVSSSLISLLPASPSFRGAVTAMEEEEKSMRRGGPETKWYRREIARSKAALRRHLSSRPIGRQARVLDAMGEARILANGLAMMEAGRRREWARARLGLPPEAVDRLSVKTLALFRVAVRLGTKLGGAELGDPEAMKSFADHARDSERKWRQKLEQVEREARETFLQNRNK